MTDDNASLGKVKQQITQIVNENNQVTFNMPTVTKDVINQNAVAKVNAQRAATIEAQKKISEAK